MAYIEDQTPGLVPPDLDLRHPLKMTKATFQRIKGLGESLSVDFTAPGELLVKVNILSVDLIVVQSVFVDIKISFPHYIQDALQRTENLFLHLMYSSCLVSDQIFISTDYFWDP